MIPFWHMGVPSEDGYAEPGVRASTAQTPDLQLVIASGEELGPRRIHAETMDVTVRLDSLGSHRILIRFRGVCLGGNRPEAQEAIVAPAARPEQPGAVGLELKVVDDALVSLGAGGEVLLRLVLIPQLDVGRTAQAIDVVHLADASDRQQVAVAGKG